jgi:IS5 family transposase
MRFLGLGLEDRIPDARTIWLFREKLTTAGAIKRLLEQLDAMLRGAGYIAMSGHDQDPLDWSLRTEFLNDRFAHAAVDRNLLGICYRLQGSWRASQPTRRAKDFAGSFFPTDVIDGHSILYCSAVDKPVVRDPGPFLG